MIAQAPSRAGAAAIQVATALLLAVAQAGGPAQAQLAATAAPARASQAAAQPGAATSGNEALDNAVAAVVVAALAEQMNTASIEVSIDSYEVGIASLRDRNVSGLGRMRLDGDEEWIGFRYSTVYDTTFSSAGYPRLTIGGVSAGEREVPNDSGLVRELEERVMVELDRQFGGRSTRLQLDDINTVQGGGRLLRINAQGIADFGLDGSTPVRIEALYDRVAGAWQRVNYDLGTASR
ncbi:hypothetical protein ACQYVW_02065 [Luteimonas sp. SDU82]